MSESRNIAVILRSDAEDVAVLTTLQQYFESKGFTQLVEHPRFIRAFGGSVEYQVAVAIQVYEEMLRNPTNDDGSLTFALPGGDLPAPSVEPAPGARPASTTPEFLGRLLYTYMHKPYGRGAPRPKRLLPTERRLERKSPRFYHHKLALGQMPRAISREKVIAFLVIWLEEATRFSGWHPDFAEVFYALRCSNQESGMWHVDVNLWISALLLNTTNAWHFSMDGNFIVNAACPLRDGVVYQAMTVSISTRNVEVYETQVI